MRREASSDFICLFFFFFICLLSAFLSQPWPRPTRNKLSWREVGRVLLRVVFVTADSPAAALTRSLAGLPWGCNVICFDLCT